jgi:RNA-directed DNA polymerase
LAFWKASRSKRHRPDQRAFAKNLEKEIQHLRDGLLAGDYPVGVYTRFTIYDPKEREICAATFPERVLHHALMNVCEPHFDKWLIFDTYACRKGKGQFKAVRRAQEFARTHVFFLKADVRKFFDSVPHDRLKALLRHKFKDNQLIFWFDRIIDTYETKPGHGLPIGNLTSQYFANLYLDPLDRFVKESLRLKGYVRYMDDFSLWHSSKNDLKKIRRDLVSFTSDSLGLSLKGVPYLNHTRHGMDFLGMRVFPQAVHLNRRSKKRFIAKMHGYEWQLACGMLSEADFQERVTALTAFVQQADSEALRKFFFRELAKNVGIEPNSSGRELEQQRKQRTLRQRELEQPEQLEQQQRFSVCLPLSIAEKLEEHMGYPLVSCFHSWNKERMAA